MKRLRAVTHFAHGPCTAHLYSGHPYLGYCKLIAANLCKGCNRSYFCILRIIDLYCLLDFAILNNEHLPFCCAYHLRVRKGYLQISIEAKCTALKKITSVTSLQMSTDSNSHRILWHHCRPAMHGRCTYAAPVWQVDYVEALVHFLTLLYISYTRLLQQY